MPEVEATPYWLDGNFAPVQEEITSFDLEIEGAIPSEFSGLYARTGADLTGWLWTGLIERSRQAPRSRTCSEIRRRVRSRWC